MIALVRKNFASLILNHSSLICKCHVSLSLSPHFFSTWRERQLATTNKVSDILVQKHQFSPEMASLAASHLTKFGCPDKADVMLSFLKDSGFSSTQLEKIVKHHPRILLHSVVSIKFKIGIFQDLGLSPEDRAKIIASTPGILRLSAMNNIIPSLSLLKDLLESNYNVARLLRKSGWFILADLQNTLLPNVELLKSCGIPMERILVLLYTAPRCLLMKPDIIRKTVEKVKDMGFSESSKMFIHVVRVIAPISQGMWEVKLQAFRDLGFSDRDILTMLKKAPLVLSVSKKKVEKVKELLLATGKFNISSIVNNPSSLGCSVEKRYKPRLRILGILENKNLIKKWPGLSTVHTLTDDKFFEKFVRPYLDELGEEYATKSYVKGKER